VSEELLARWRLEERAQPEGWSFADLDGRMRTDPMPWDFETVCVEALASTPGRALDMGTGGGETLLRLRDAVVGRGGSFPMTTATEGWPANVPVAQAALGPAGIEVVEFGQPDDLLTVAPMPFDDGVFALVINRHESYHPAEVARVLAPGGVFLTQQVGGDELGELHALLGHEPAAPHVRYMEFREALAAADGAEYVGGYVFADVAALVAYLQRVPWDAPEDFTVDRYRTQLLALHERTRGGEVRMTMKRFWLRAERLPAAGVR